jgi:hypothetical protein
MRSPDAGRLHDKQSRPRTSSSTLTISSPSGNSSVRRGQGDFQIIANFLRELRVGAAGEELEALRVYFFHAQPRE